MVKKIKRIWYHNLIELYEDSEGFQLKSHDYFIQSIFIFARYNQYKFTTRGETEGEFIDHFDNYFELTRYIKKERYISGRFLINLN